MKALKYAAAIAAAATGITSISVFAQSTSPALARFNVPRLMRTAKANGLNPKALKAALNAYSWAYDHGKLGSNKNTLTVVDFSLPSNQKRLWVIDLTNDKVLMNTYTAQGKNSGLVYATHFSNRPGSDESSLGIYSTGGVFYGEHARAMHLNGLEQGVNSNASSRAVEVHSAAYVTPEFIKAHHRAGRSWGCFAVNPAVKDQLIDYTKGGSALFAYAPQEASDPVVTSGPLSLA